METNCMKLQRFARTHWSYSTRNLLRGKWQSDSDVDLKNLEPAMTGWFKTVAGQKMLKKSGPAHVRQGTETVMCTTSTAVLRAVSYMFGETRYSCGSYSLALTAHTCIWKIWIFAEEYALWHLDNSSNQWIRINLSKGIVGPKSCLLPVLHLASPEMLVRRGVFPM